ncbi:MAG TPA: energy transducer TonB [Saprospiraceae bacterium]|nr:energy transducer TonB [Saprospiraceae bacterium]
MKKEHKAKDFLPKPEYAGGPNAMRSFIYQRLVYPEAALQSGIEGTVIAKAEINYQGKVLQVKILSGIGYGCDEEAARLIKLLVFKMAKVRNIKVSYFKTFHIEFKRPSKPSSSISYHYLKTPPKVSTPVEGQKPSTAYEYTIQIR